jgi:hypothetical protein
VWRQTLTRLIISLNRALIKSLKRALKSLNKEAFKYIIKKRCGGNPCPVSWNVAIFMLLMGRARGSLRLSSSPLASGLCAAYSYAHREREREREAVELPFGLRSSAAYISISIYLSIDIGAA